MPELEPITREEKFLNGEVGMTPITREEKILAGEDIETVTRREYFLKKYRGGGGGDVTVVPLSVTENGTYSEEGKAYSPVNVNVPLPQNAYLLKSVANLPQAIASFNDGEDMVMPSLKVAIEPQQEGSGDPSPTNVRPISGWTGVNITDKDDISNPTVTRTWAIAWQTEAGTVYGGYIELVFVNGEWKWHLRAERTKWVILPTASEISSVDTKDCRLILSNAQKPINANVSINKGMSDKYIVTNYSEQYNNHIHFPNTSFVSVYSADEVGATKQAWIDYFTQMQIEISYMLETPIDYYLPITDFPTSLRGVNNVYANTGDITDAEYFSKEV